MATAQPENNSELVESLENLGGRAERGVSEEKKSFDEENHPSTVDACLVNASGGALEDSDSEPEDPRFSKFEDLPEELEFLRARVFDTQDELLNELERLGFGDLRVILDDDGKAYLFIPSDNHNEATSEVVRKFNKWAADWKGCVTGEHNAIIDQSYPITPTPKKQRRLRQPDVSFWGFPKCGRTANGPLKPKPAHPPSNFPKLNLDVVIQFCWRNKKSYEYEALNDMMIRTATVPKDTPPRLGYLIKVRFETSRSKAGFDIYKVPHGATIADAENSRNGAQKLTYNVGEQDVVITIAPADLGIPTAGFWNSLRGMFCGDFKISMKELYDVSAS